MPLPSPPAEEVRWIRPWPLEDLQPRCRLIFASAWPRLAERRIFVLRPPSLAEHKTHLWSLERLARIEFAGCALTAADEMVVLGLSMVTGSALEYEHRVSKVCSEFCAQRARFVPKRLYLGLSCDSLFLAFEILGSLWNDMAEWTRSSNRRFRKAMGIREPLWRGVGELAYSILQE